jgi:hypothetical protein
MLKKSAPLRNYQIQREDRLFSQIIIKATGRTPVFVEIT